MQYCYGVSDITFTAKLPINVRARISIITTPQEIYLRKFLRPNLRFRLFSEHVERSVYYKTLANAQKLLGKLRLREYQLVF